MIIILDPYYAAEEAVWWDGDRNAIAEVFPLPREAYNGEIPLSLANSDQYFAGAVRAAMVKATNFMVKKPFTFKPKTPIV
jgi:hypothetical protein